MKHREQASNIFTHINKLINYGIFRDKSYLRINNEIIPILAELESNGIYVDELCFKNRFNSKVHNGYVYSQYNIYTSTGRPSNRFGGVNYAALQKDNGSRSCFISRFGENGIMMMMDYSAFHPHIICELTNFPMSFDVDFYAYMAKLCFKKEDVDSQDISDAKSLTFRQLYGGVEEEYSHIKFFYNLKSFIDSHWKEYKENGFTRTPIFGRKIKNVMEPNPSKIFNYILQATETEISVPILGKVNSYLRNKKSKAVIYTYDSVLFDINLDEMDVVKQELSYLMRDNNRFPIKCYVGKSYDDLKQISV
jgi:DNA polymerase I-like protein with 3'-5' exonuclease and polymerase domains